MSNEYWKSQKTEKLDMSSKDIISAKCNILKKIDVNIRTKLSLREVCMLFLTSYDMYKWSELNMEEFNGLVQELLETKTEQDLILATYMIKGLKRK